MAASVIGSVILLLLMGLAFGAVILNLFDRDEDSGDEDSRDDKVK